jgi:hypothetical protein
MRPVENGWHEVSINAGRWRNTAGAEWGISGPIDWSTDGDNPLPTVIPPDTASKARTCIYFLWALAWALNGNCERR